MAVKIKGIDVSTFQTKVDWNEIKRQGFKFVIVRCGYRGALKGNLVEDNKFMSHIKGAKAAGLDVGVYFFSEAINAEEGRAEADYAVQLVKKSGVKLDYPIAIDSENVFIEVSKGKKLPGRANSNQISTAKRTAAVKAFCEQIEKLGYESMIYASTSWLNNQLNMKELPYNVWVAQYAKKCEYKGDYQIWQYTSTKVLKGVIGNNGKTDCNYCYIDRWDSDAIAKKKVKAEKKKKVLLREDGKFDKSCVIAMQKWLGSVQDGHITSQNKNLKKYFPNIIGVCTWGGKGSPVIKLLQKKVKVSVDGLLGKQTVSALQKFLKVEVDGIWGPKTSLAFQKYLNKVLK